MLDKTETLQRAAEIWDYMSGFQSNGNSDAIVICCSYDLRVCDHACELLNENISDTLIISGKHGNWTQHLWEKTEAEAFYTRAMDNGVKPRQILMEQDATNFGENIRFSKALIPDAASITFVTKPNSLLRVKLTAEAQWPEAKAWVSCPDIDFPAEVSNIVGVWGVINEMVGDIERIRQYPAKGFQVEHVLPERILENYEFLVENGFNAHSLAES